MLTERWYQRALDLATKGGLVEAEARALEGVAQSVLSLRGKAAAREYFSQAIAKYNVLGSKVDVARLSPFVS